MSEDLIRRSDAIDALGEEPYVWTDDDEFAIGERSQWIDDVSAIKAVSAVAFSGEEGSVNKKYVLSELSDLLDEYSELDENGLHDPKWCGVSEAYGVIKAAPATDRPKGKWIAIEGMQPPELHGKHYCFNCGHVLHLALNGGVYNFCPCCGAIMTEESDDE